MATLPITLDGASFPFQGFAASTPMYEKGDPLTNTIASLGSTARDSLIDDCLARFGWMRVHCLGGEHYASNPAGTYNYPARTQSADIAYLNRRAGPFKWIVSPFAAPAVAMSAGIQTTARHAPPNYADGTQDHLGTTLAWQQTKDAIEDGIRKLRLAGCDVRIISHPNEVGNRSVPNFWSTRHTPAQYVDFVNKVWLGTGLTGGGLKTLFPTTVFQAGDTGGSTGHLRADFRAALFADATALAECTYFDAHIYEDGLNSESQQLLGISTDTAAWGKCIVGEFGAYNSGSTADATTAKITARLPHDSIVYGKAPVVGVFTPLRDITAKNVAAPNGVTFTAKPLADLNTGAGTYSYTPMWWALKPYLLAAGRAPCTALCVSSRTTSDSAFDPATGVFLTTFIRSNGSIGVVYVNWSGSSRTDVIEFRTGGAAIEKSGTRRTYSVMGSSAQESAASAVSTTAGQISLGSVANQSIVLLEIAA